MNFKILKIILIFSLISQIAIGGHSRGDWRKQSYYGLKKITNNQTVEFAPNKTISFDFNKKSHLLFFILLSFQIIIPPAKALTPDQPSKNITGNCAKDVQPAETSNIPTLIRQAVQTAMECFNSPINATCQRQYYHSLPFLPQKRLINELYEDLTSFAQGAFHKVFVAKPRHARLDQDIDQIVVSIETVSVGWPQMPPQLRLQGLLTKNSNETSGADRFLVKALGIYLGPIIEKLERLNIPVSWETMEWIKNSREDYWNYRLQPNDTAWFDFSRPNNFPLGADFGEVPDGLELLPVPPNNDNAARLPLLYIEYEKLHGDVRSSFPTMSSNEQQALLLEFFIVENIFYKLGINLNDPRDNHVGLRCVDTHRLYLFNGHYYLFKSSFMPVFLDADFFRIQCDPYRTSSTDTPVHDGYLAYILKWLNLTLNPAHLSQFKISSKEAEQLIDQGIEFHDADKVQCGVLPAYDWNSW